MSREKTRVLDGLWGKLNDESGAVQPLAAHLADVAAVIERILKSPLYQRRMERLLGEPPGEELLSRLCVLAAWHDFGKISPLFQLKRQEKMEGLEPRRSVNHIQTALNASSLGKPFQEVVQPFLAWSDEDVFLQYLLLILSHHGAKIPDSEIPNCGSDKGNYWTKNGCYDPWQALQELMELSHEWFPAAFQQGGQPLPEKAEFQHLYAGTLMLADWIASDSRLFPFCGENGRPCVSEENPIVYARHNAEAVLKDIGWDLSDKRPARPPQFDAQFGFSANGIQKAVDSLKLNPDGGLYILEAETGSGKTEAALRLYTRLFSAGLVDGLYFANPLRFAATQLFERMVTFSGKTFGEGVVPVTLAVPGYLRVDDKTGLRLPKYQVDWGELNRRGIGWSAESPKRFLAAPLASGTVDQALMATLRVQHAHMRAAALQRSLLVIDEVHSSDAYMGQLIRDLILWFRLLGGHVLLMSATLGGCDRQKYMDVWRCAKIKGSRGRAKLSFDEAQCCPYPLLSTPDAQTAVEFEKARQKCVTMLTKPLLREPDAVAELAAELYNSSSGHKPCVLILRNTVRQARLVVQALKKIISENDIFSVGGIPAAHHSRYAREDRRLFDREVERRFGKDGNPLDRPRKGCILVATQTLEQSLDVDFDLLITDLCPADVLLQRIGRLHRHARTARPDAFAQPQCVVLVPGVDFDWLLTREALSYGFGLERAYDNLLSVAATWRLLLDNPVWTLPQQNRYLVESAVHPDALEKICGELGSKEWKKSSEDTEGTKIAEKGAAKLATLAWDTSFRENVISRDEGRLTTRLGLMDRTVKIDPAVPSPFGGDDLKSLSIPGWFFAQQEKPQEDLKPTDDEKTVTMERHDDFWNFTLENQRFYYGQMGLLSEREFEEMKME